MQLPELAPTELEVMRALWSAERMSAREVHDRIGPRLGWEYSTTRTVLGRLVKKGVVYRTDFHGLQLYSSAISRPQGLARFVRDFAQRVLLADPAPVVSLLADEGDLTEAEVIEIKRLIEESEDDA
jgi:predicted transcriptional regulator